jgi:hypothetical protein
MGPDNDVLDLVKSGVINYWSQLYNEDTERIHADFPTFEASP